MPECGSQIILCDLPIRFDTYTGCSHGCTYCFTRKKNANLSAVIPSESAGSIRRFIRGERKETTKWCDWDIPLHWGGMSDGFQPVEKKEGRSLDALKAFAETGYPVVISTKGALIASPDYLSVLRAANAVVQVSIASPLYDASEPGAPAFDERLEMLRRLSPCSKRTIARVQPYIIEAHDSILEGLEKIRDTGCSGVVVEGLKAAKKKNGLVRIGQDYCYQVSALRRRFSEIRDRCHELGMRFYCGENRLRSMGDHLCCCGIDGLAGFKGTEANGNHHFFSGGAKYTKRMEETGTAMVFRNAFAQKTESARLLERLSYAKVMEKVLKTRTVHRIFGKGGSTPTPALQLAVT